MIKSKFKILILKHKLRKYNKHDTIYIRELERKIIELKNPYQYTFVYCTECNNELISSKSFIKDDKNGVEYICSKCGVKSLWYFEAPCPILIEVDGKKYIGE